MFLCFFMKTTPSHSGKELFAVHLHSKGGRYVNCNQIERRRLGFR